MPKFKVQIWHANSPDGVLSAVGSRGGSIPLDIAAEHTLRHTIELEAENELVASKLALECVLPQLSPLEPDHVRVLSWTPDRHTTAGDVLYVFDHQTMEVRAVYRWRGGFDAEDFTRLESLPAQLTGHSLQ